MIIHGNGANMHLIKNNEADFIITSPPYFSDESELDLMKPLKTHLVPPGSKWNYVWGSATLFCLIIPNVLGSAYLKFISLYGLGAEIV